MFNSFSTVWNFLNYWYFRYLMVTELYMVEKWERAICNTVIVIILCMLTYLNCTVLYYTSKFWNITFGNYSEIESPI
uniref:Putative serine palmitoyltransferase small subunit a n=1 Tax=Triatoma dimidiata TaxID=72491 RepID=A0A0V0GCN9_TRIDM